MKVAIVHDYLTQRGGAERVVLEMLRTFPGAELITSLYHPAGTYPQFALCAPKTLLPSIFANNHRAAFPLLAPTFSRAKTKADVIVASSSGWAHGFKPDSRPQIVYCHSPARWLYRPNEYATPTVGRIALVALRQRLIAWDKAAALRATRILTNSQWMRSEIARTWGLDATVLPPCLSLDPDGEIQEIPSLGNDFYLLVSRLLPYKNVDVAIETFRGMPQRRLVIVGDGPLRKKLMKSPPSNVRLLREVTEAELRWLYKTARAVVAPALEDFGLTPVEAAAMGAPTIALRSRGYLDTIEEGATGLFFDDLMIGSVQAAIREAETTKFDERVLRAQAEKFSRKGFSDELRTIVTETFLRSERSI